MPTSTRSRGYRKKPGVEPPGSPGSTPLDPGVYLPPEESLPDYSPTEATPSAPAAAGTLAPLVDHTALHEAAVKRVEEKKADKRTSIVNTLLNTPLPGQPSALHSNIVTEPDQQNLLAEILTTGEKDTADKKEKLSALTAALQESSAHNLPIKGPGGGWRQEESEFYPEEDITNPKRGATNFFEEAKTDTGGTRGKDETVSGLTQTIQGSGAGEFYYKDNVPEARQLLHQWEQSKWLTPKGKQVLHQAERLGIPKRQLGDVEHVDPQRQTVKVKADAKGMVQWLEHLEGQHEGTPRIERLTENFGLNSVSQPWCANLASNGLLRRGFQRNELPANPNYSGGEGGFETWGEEGKYAHVVGRGEADLKHAKPGDILTFSGEHTATYVGNGEMISGNFGDEVERTPVSAHANLSMIIRPNYKGGTVEIPVEQASILPTGEVGSGAPVSGEALSTGSTPESTTTPTLNVADLIQPPAAPTQDKSSLAMQLLFGGGQNEDPVNALLNSPLPALKPGLSEELSNEELLKLLLERA